MKSTPKFRHLDNYFKMQYPFGFFWNQIYIDNTAKTINKIAVNDKVQTLIFIARGTSGAMIAGGVISSLSFINPDMRTFLIISNDPEIPSHKETLEGLQFLYSHKIVIIDDFITTGETMRRILKDLKNYSTLHIPSLPEKYYMLCIGNTGAEDAIKKKNNSRYKEWREILSNFEYVICPPKRLKEK